METIDMEIKDQNLSHLELLSLAKKTIMKEEIEKKVEKEKNFWHRKNQRRITARKNEYDTGRQTQANELNALISIHAETPMNMNFKCIPGFENAITATMSCNHLHVKSWGSNYTKGMKCVSCSKELSRTHMDPDHARGHDATLDKGVEQHRRGTFRFKTSFELQNVEKERIRLEKEEREMELDEIQFYDRTNLKGNINIPILI